MDGAEEPADSWEHPEAQEEEVEQQEPEDSWDHSEAHELEQPDSKAVAHLRAAGG